MLTKKIKKIKSLSKKVPKKNSTPAGIKRLNPGPRLSDAVICGNVVYVAGKVAIKNKGKSVTHQTKEILQVIDRILKDAGTNKSKLLTANIWLTKIATAPEMNAVWDNWVSAGNTPARATVEARLVDPAYDVEIMVTAAI